MSEFGGDFESGGFDVEPDTSPEPATETSENISNELSTETDFANNETAAPPEDIRIAEQDVNDYFQGLEFEEDPTDYSNVNEESPEYFGLLSTPPEDIKLTDDDVNDFIAGVKLETEPKDFTDINEVGPVFPSENEPVDVKNYEGRNPELLPSLEEFPTGGAAAGMAGDATDDTTAAAFDAISDDAADDSLSSDFVDMEEAEQYDLHPEDWMAIEEPDSQDLTELAGLSEQEIPEGQQATDVDDATEILQTEDITSETDEYTEVTPDDIQQDINEINAEMEHDAASLGGDILDESPDMQTVIDETAEEEIIDVSAESTEYPAITHEDIQNEIDETNAEMEQDATLVGDNATSEVIEEEHSDTLVVNTPEDYAAGLPGTQEELEEIDVTDDMPLETEIPEALFVPEPDVTEETDESESQEELAPEENLTDIAEEIDTSDINDEKNYFEDNDRITGILGDFKQDTWDNKDINDQKATIERLADYNADVLGVENKPRIEYYNKPDKSDFGASGKDINGNPVIRINEYTMSNSEETADTIAHEYRHVYQNERATLGQNDLDNRYRENLKPTNYVQAQEDFDGYKNQLIERDARAYARGFKDIIKNI